MIFIPDTSKRRPLRNRQVRGIALIETMVGILIFTTGILGVIGLQAAMTRAQGSAQYRSDAAVLAGELIGAMWSDSANASSATLLNYESTSSTACTHAPCAQWLAKVASTLPLGAATIAVTSATGQVVVTVSWTLPSDGEHRYVTTTAIR